jgi:hypothetical protein
VARLVLLVGLECFIHRCGALELAGEPLPHHDQVGFAAVQQGYDALELLVRPRT